VSVPGIPPYRVSTRMGGRHVHVSRIYRPSRARHGPFAVNPLSAILWHAPPHGGVSRDSYAVVNPTPNVRGGYVSLGCRTGVFPVVQSN
jgi:hypothetical protein